MNYFEPYELQFDEKQRKTLISQSLERLRKANGYSQKKVAEILGISPVTYNGYENGKSEPSGEMLVRLSFLFHVPTDVILQRDSFELNSTDIEEQLSNYKEKLAEYREQATIKNNSQILEMIGTIEKFVGVLEEIKDYTQNNNIENQKENTETENGET